MRGLPTDELDGLIRRAAEQAGEALSASGLRKALPKAYRVSADRLRTRLHALVAEGSLHAWPGRPARFAAHGFDSYVEAHIVEVLGRHPDMTTAEIVRHVPSQARRRVPKALEQLLLAGRVHRHPPKGRRHPFGLQPADALEYLRPPLEELLARMKRQGFEHDALLEALQRYAGGPPAALHPDDEADAVLEAIVELNPDARHGAMVYIPHLRYALSGRLRDKLSFDRVLLSLLARGKLQAQSHPAPGQLRPGEKEAMVPDGRGGHYMVVSLRTDLGA
jgi:hypothetical protein